MEQNPAAVTPSDFVLMMERLQLSATSPPLLFAIVDTEEEFDWSAPFSRSNTSVTAIRHIDRVHGVFSRFGVRPTYVIDFPVATQPDGYGPLRDLSESGEACIGAHLHPWVNPPFREELSGPNSFGCRLGEPLEAEKIRVLQAAIGDGFGHRPIVYKAGRYGFGRTTVTALQALNFEIDVSINPRMDFTPEGGPSFEAFDAAPFFFGRDQRLLEIPCTTGYTGAAGSYAARLHRLISTNAGRRLHLVGILSRLRVVDKVMLSPEGYTLAEMKALTTTLLRRGTRTFSLTLHSPSVQPGCTPYVRTTAELREFVDRIAAYLEFFFGELGGLASTPEEFRKSLTPESSVGSAAIPLLEP